MAEMEDDWYYNMDTKEYKQFRPGMAIPVVDASSTYPWVKVAPGCTIITEGANTTRWNPPPESVLSEAKRLVEGGERNEAYGDPKEDFGRTIGMVNALLAKKLKEPLTESDWAKMMVCSKLSRSMNRVHREDPVDAAGYAATWHRCETGEW